MILTIGPDFISSQVRDLEASRRFQIEIIGLEAAPEIRPNAAAFATQPIEFVIRKALANLEAIASLGYGVILWFPTADAFALLKLLKERTVPIVQCLANRPFRKMFSFRDPNGYLITVHDGS